MKLVRNEISLVLHVFFLPSVLEEGVFVSGKLFVESILELSMPISTLLAKKHDWWVDSYSWLVDNLCFFDTVLHLEMVDKPRLLIISYL